MNPNALSQDKDQEKQQKYPVDSSTSQDVKQRFKKHMKYVPLVPELHRSDKDQPQALISSLYSRGTGHEEEEARQGFPVAPPRPHEFDRSTHEQRLHAAENVIEHLASATVCIL